MGMHPSGAAGECRGCARGSAPWGPEHRGPCKPQAGLEAAGMGQEHQPPFTAALRRAQTPEMRSADVSSCLQKDRTSWEQAATSAPDGLGGEKRGGEVF